MALQSIHRISFDEVVRVMKATGRDLPKIYRETSEGGLAIGYRFPPAKSLSENPGNHDAN